VCVCVRTHACTFRVAMSEWSLSEWSLPGHLHRHTRALHKLLKHKWYYLTNTYTI